MKTVVNRAFEELVRPENKEKVRRRPVLQRGIAASAIFLSVGAGAYQYSSQQAAGVVPNATLSAEDIDRGRNSNLQRADIAIDTSQARREDLRRAAVEMHDNEVVSTAAAYSANVLTDLVPVQQSERGASGIVSQRVSSTDNFQVYDQDRCDSASDTTREVSVDTLLYPGGIGVMTLRIGASACRSVDISAMTLSVQMEHPGRNEFNLEAALAQIQTNPASVEVSSLQVEHGGERAYISNTLRGTGLAGETISIKDHTGEVVRPSSYEEAEQSAEKANTLALDVLKTVRSD